MTTLLLTSTVNVNKTKDFIFQINKDDRLNVYLKSIRKWLYYTKFNIVLVENSNYIFNELINEILNFSDRFEIVSFKEEALEDYDKIKFDKSKGVSEIYAINYAFSKSKLLQNSNFIIKITARFFIPELESFLQNYDLTNYDCLTQNNKNRCELVGCNINNFNVIFSKNIVNEQNKYDWHVENIYRFRCSNFNNVLTCKEFKIEPTLRGGVNKYYYTI